MSAGKLRVNVFDLVAAIAKVVDMMSPAVGNHHMQVAYLAYRLSKELDLPADKRYELFTAGALHDIGAFSLQERIDLLEFEDAKPGQHSMAGSLILKKFKPFASIAKLIQFHHVPWQNGQGSLYQGEPVPLGSHLLHLADRTAVKIFKDKPILSQVRGICDAISSLKGEAFVPEHVDALLRLAKREYIWLEIISDSMEEILRRSVGGHAREVTMNELVDFSRLICQLIDFKSEFTATHSSGVAATSVFLSKLAGFSSHERRMIQIAAYLHDLGKLAIPSEILEKRDKLTEDECFIMRSHVYHTYQTLEPFEALGTINSWGSLHQERLNGTGYPFGDKEDELPLGSRIIAVADVFTALTEHRPYRQQSMEKKAALEVLHSMAGNGELDNHLIHIMATHYDEMNEIRDTAQQQAIHEYDEFQKSLNPQGNVLKKRLGWKSTVS